MSYKRHHADVSTGGAGIQMQSARRPSTQASIFKQEIFDSSSPEESKPQRTPSDGAESDVSSDRPGRPRKKAEPVKSACAQCQKRKTKCSGQRPVCRFCSDRNLECSWDIGDGLTRNADLKQKLHEANLKSEELGDLVRAMRTGTDQTSSMLLARLRLGCSMEELLANIRLDESSGESRQGSMDQQMMASGQNVPVTVGMGYPSPASPEHQFEWPVPGPQLHQMQPNQNWMTDANAQYYQPNNQQPFFTTPNYNRPQMPWPRHDSFYPTENNIKSDNNAQGFNTPQNKDAVLPSGVTMIPRTNSDAFSAHSAGARRGHVPDP